MNVKGNSILTINGGSSSVKFATFSVHGSLQVHAKGQIERIGSPQAVFTVKATARDDRPAERFSRPVAALDYVSAAAVLIDWIEEQEIDARLIAVGHRIVHGGPNFHIAQLLEPALMEELRRLTPLDPEHMPGEVLLAEAFHKRFPQVPQIACFDTAFHHDLPRVARLLPIPRRYETQGVRRYGFHGLSYEFLMSELVRTEGVTAARGRIILAHLGNGASLAAVAEGVPVDTSMGFTPAAGVPMGTRAGDLDPGLAGYLARSENMTAKQFDDMINFRSGLLGVSETSADMRDLLLREADDPRAAEAVTMFCYQVRKWIGAYCAALGGLDMLVFAGGIGEKASVVRSRICSGLGFLGVDLDAARNERNTGVISMDTSRVKVRVVRTNEELVIARSVCRVLGINAEPSPDNLQV